jgi:hypothetical protein
MTQSWVEQLSEESLLRELPPTVAANIRDLAATGYEPEQIGALIAANPTHYLGTKGSGRATADLWARTKIELRLLICTDDPKYQDVRAGLGKESKVTGAVVLALISSAVSAHLGVEAGTATPFVVLLLMALLRTTKEAWCAQLQAAEQHMPDAPDNRM